MELDSKFNEGRPRSDMSVCLHVGGDLVRESCEDSRLVSKSDMPKSLNKQLSTSHAWHLQAPAACMELSGTLGLWLLLSRPLPEAEDRVEKKLGRSILLYRMLLRCFLPTVYTPLVRSHMSLGSYCQRTAGGFN